MKLSISNIAWDSGSDLTIYENMKSRSFTGLEIAPTKIWGADAYKCTREAVEWKNRLSDIYGLSVSSMQSIWYGRSDLIFGSEEERNILLEYTKRAIEFAEVIECGNLVFGCPKNRKIPDGADTSCIVSFFGELGEYAHKHNTVFSLEANPGIYDTNFINTTAEAIDLIEQIDSEGFRLNLDLGTMIANSENISVLSGKEHLVNHIHISEPFLASIKERDIHRDLSALLHKIDYQNYISIETKTTDDLEGLFKTMNYISEVFS